MNKSHINYSILTLAALSVSISLSFGIFTTGSISEIFAQGTTSSSSTWNVLITKDLTNSYTISSGSSQIGLFNAKYTILGNIDNLKKEQKLVISTVTSDFNSSPVAGYVKASSGGSGQQQQQQQQNPTLANPFADKSTINQKITTEINNAISSASSANTAKASIQCDFGTNIGQWSCKSHGLVG
jgi:hypothetical protein